MKKKYLLVALAVVLVGTFIFSFTHKDTFYRKDKVDSKLEANHIIKKRLEETKTDGSYVIGKDLPEGEYVLVTVDIKKQNKVVGNYTLYQDNSKKKVLDFAEIIVNKEDLLKNKQLPKSEFKMRDLSEYSSDLVLLKKDQLIELKNIKMYPADLRVQPDTSKIIDGTYKVGRDIPKGTYTVSSYNPTSTKLHTIWVLSDVDPEVDVEDSLITKYQDYTDHVYPKEIVLKEGQYISFDDLIFSKKK